jgi:TatD family-associated radical SAM protein
MSEQVISYKIRNSLYLSVNDRCTLVCEFCPKTKGETKVHEYDLKIEHRPEFEEVVKSVGDPSVYDEIVFCGYGEPTLRLNLVLAVAKWVKEHGGRVRINTDGLANLVHKRNVLPEMQGVIDSLSISMNAQNEAVYNQHCQPQLEGSYDAMLEFLKLAPKYIKTVVASAIDGLEGVDIDKCREIAQSLGVEFKTRHLDIVG